MDILTRYICKLDYVTDDNEEKILSYEILGKKDPILTMDENGFLQIKFRGFLFFNKKLNYIQAMKAYPDIYAHEIDSKDITYVNINTPILDMILSFEDNSQQIAIKCILSLPNLDIQNPVLLNYNYILKRI